MSITKLTEEPNAFVLVDFDRMLFRSAKEISMSIAGILSNIDEAWNIHKNKAMHSSFGALGLSHIIATLVTLVS